MILFILSGHKVVPCNSVLEWGRAFEMSDRRVKRDDIADDVTVSTVFLGIDHRIWVGPPLLFETIIFGGQHDQYCERYSTWDEAIAGHEKAVALAKSKAIDIAP